MSPKLWDNITLLLLIGYVSLGRSFAYVGIPAAKIFIGDVVLCLFLILRSRVVWDSLIPALTRPTAISQFAWMVVLFLFYGISQILHGLQAGYSPVPAIQNFVFNTYVLYFFLGAWVGSHSPELMRKGIRILAWTSCIYAPVFLLVLDKIRLNIPGTDVPVFTQAGGAPLVVLGLLCYERPLRWYWIPLAINAFMILATEIRAEWLSMIVALTLWILLTGHFKKAALTCSIFAGLLAAGYATDFSIPAPAGRGGSISSREIVGRAVSAVDPELGREYTRNAYDYAGTVSWRTRWWKEIWESVHRDPVTALFGFGYGYPLGDLVPYLRNTDIRTPHNVFFYALGYGGWVGVALFFGLQFNLARLLYRTYRINGQPLGLMIAVMAMTAGLFGNLFETPFGAIPLYLILGLASGPLFSTEPSEYGCSGSSQLVPATRW